MPRDDEEVDKYLATMMDKCVAIIAEKYLATILEALIGRFCILKPHLSCLASTGWVGKWL